MSQYSNDSLYPKNIGDDKTLESGLLAALYRRECPDTMAIGEYQLGLLPEPEQIQLKAHLERCPHCQGELARLAEFLTEEPIPTMPPVADEAQTWTLGDGFRWLKEKTGAFIIRFETTVLPSASLHPQFSGATRGHSSDTDPEKNAIRQIYLTPDQVDDLDLEITIYKSAEVPELCTLTIRAEVPSRWPDMSGLRVRAVADHWQGEDVTNEEGQVVFEGLPADLADKVVFEISP